MASAWDKFVPMWRGVDEGRVAFVIGRKQKGSPRWRMFRCSVQCFESGDWSSADDAKAWGDRLTQRRPVQWERNESKEGF